MNAHGTLTAKIASQISAEWEARGYDVLYDHGSQKESDSVGKIVSWFGEDYKRETELSQVDIAIVKKGSNDVFALIEIEETTDRPKTLIGDIFGILMGEHVSFGRDRELHLGENTMLIVLGQSQVRHEGRNKYIQDTAMKMKSHLSTVNEGIGKIVIDTFADEQELAARVRTSPPSHLPSE